MGIRAAGASDREPIRDIYNDAVINSTATFDLEPRSDEDQAAWFAEHVPPYSLIVWEEDEQVVGWASLSPYRARPAYRFSTEGSVYVDPGSRGRGIGEALLRELIVLARENGFHTLVALITEENEPSVCLAEKMGFFRTGTMIEVGFKFDRWLNVAVYQYMLGNGPK